MSLPLVLVRMSWSVTSMERTDDGVRSACVYVIASARGRSLADEERVEIRNLNPDPDSGSAIPTAPYSHQAPLKASPANANPRSQV